MVTLRNNRKIAATKKDNQEESSKSNQLWNTIFPGIQEEYITQMSEEVERRLTKILSHELSRTESRILGALSKLDEFIQNPQLRVHSGSFPKTSPNSIAKIRKEMRIVPRMILILQSVPLSPCPLKT